MKRKIYVLVIFVLAVSNAWALPVEWKLADGGNGHFYEAILVPEGITWTEAKLAAETAGGYLATITSSAENEFVFSLVADNYAFWKWAGTYNNIGEGPLIGGFKDSADSQWQWVTGEPFLYTNWASQEPSGRPDETKLHFFGGPYCLIASTWNDVQHDWPEKGYIVEFVPEPATLLLLGLGGLALRRRR